MLLRDWMAWAKVVELALKSGEPDAVFLTLLHTRADTLVTILRSYEPRPAEPRRSSTNQ